MGLFRGMGATMLREPVQFAIYYPVVSEQVPRACVWACVRVYVRACHGIKRMYRNSKKLLVQNRFVSPPLLS